MLTLDKVQLLEDRIKKAVSLINRLREENGSLNEQIQILKSHNDELKDFAENYSHDSELIEMGISKALSQLDQVEGLNDEITAEDASRLAELDEMDFHASPAAASSDGQDSTDSGDNAPVLGYEDEDDPLI
jgi:predicted RNase H-like nuclease (RuvC/YqgF family)